MNAKKMTLSLIFLTIILFSFSTPTLAALEVANYKINGKQESVKMNPSRGDIAHIEISANVPVKFSTIAVCLQSDSVCNRATAVKYFTKTDAFVLSVNRDWNGKTSKGGIVSSGDYKIKTTIKDEVGAEKTQELSPYVIIVDSDVPNISSDLEAKSSTFAISSSQSQSTTASSFAGDKINPDNDPVVKKIRDFIASGGEKSAGVTDDVFKNKIKKCPPKIWEIMKKKLKKQKR